MISRHVLGGSISVVFLRRSDLRAAAHEGAILQQRAPLAFQAAAICAGGSATRSMDLTGNKQRHSRRNHVYHVSLIFGCSIFAPLDLHVVAGCTCTCHHAAWRRASAGH